MPIIRHGTEEPNCKHITCPNCGESRPWDWFRQYLYCWKCRGLYKECRDVIATPADQIRNERKEHREWN